MRKAYHHGDLARALVDQAIAIVAETGIEGLTLNEAARRAGVSHAAVYRHFEDKHALLAGVAERGFAGLGATMKEAIETAPTRPRQAFLHVGRAVVLFAVREPVLYRVMFSGVKAARIEVYAAAPADTPFGMLLDLVRRLQEKGLLRRGDPLDHALAMWSTTHGLAALLTSGDIPASRKRAADLADAIHGTLLDGLRPRG